MISRSTDVRAALRERSVQRAAQRGFINPYLFAAAASDFNPHTGVTSATLSMWVDPADGANVSITHDVTYGDIFSSATCKITGTVFSQATAAQAPQVDTTSMSARSMAFGTGGTVRYLNNATGISITGSVMTAFMVIFWGLRSAQYSALALHHGTATNSLQSNAGAPTVMAFTSVSGGGGAGEAYLSGTVYTYNTATTIARGASGLFEFYEKNPNSGSGITLNGTALACTYGGSASAPPTPMNFNTIGSSDTLYYPNGNIGEILVYTGTPSSGDITNIRAYLKAKWGTP